MKFNNKDIEHLQFIYDRMKSVHNENENLDYMIKFQELIKSLKKSVILNPKTLKLTVSKNCYHKHKK